MGISDLDIITENIVIAYFKRVYSGPEAFAGLKILR